MRGINQLHHNELAVLRARVYRLEEALVISHSLIAELRDALVGQPEINKMLTCEKQSTRQWNELNRIIEESEVDEISYHVDVITGKYEDG